MILVYEENLVVQDLEVFLVLSGRKASAEKEASEDLPVTLDLKVKEVNMECGVFPVRMALWV